MEWQFIDTAPKDGSDILCCQPDEYHPNKFLVYTCYYSDGKWWEVTGQSPLYYDPRFWMPLPELPKVTYKNV